MDFLKIYLLFWFFSICGWVMEVIVCSCYDKKLVNRGFLIGPYCPIYGFGALIMLFLAPYKDHLLACFILSLVLCSFLEYFTSYLMEKLFKIRWWDYSNDSFNINGRVCLRNAIAFGALGVLFTRYLNPWYFIVINSLTSKTIIIISIIIFVITIIDILVSFNAMNSIKNVIKNNIDKFHNKDATDDVKKMINKKILSFNFIERRLIQTYHLFEKEKEYIKRTIQKVNNKTKSGYGLLLVFIVLGIIAGLIMSLVFNVGSYKIVIPFMVSLSSLIAFIIMKVGNK